jgi:hypothetical protein
MARKSWSCGSRRSSNSRLLLQTRTSRREPFETLRKRTTITAIAAVLEVNPSDITLSSPSSLPAPPKNQSLLKLKAIQSATELGTVASRADKYQWRLEVDPKAATASRMQAVLQIIDRLVQGLRTDSNGHRVAYDEFDGEQFGEIPRLARLQELLNELLTNEVAVLAGTYSFSRLRNVDEVDDFILPPVVFVNIPDKPRKVIYTSIILLIRFVPSLVNDVVVPVNTGVSAQDFDPAHIEVSDHFFPF